MKSYIYLLIVVLGIVLSIYEIPGRVDASLPALALSLMLLGLVGYNATRIARLEQTIKKLEGNIPKS